MPPCGARGSALTWGRVASVLRRALSALASRGRARTAASMATSGHVSTTAPTSSDSGRPRLDLTARALRLHNRCPKAAARYLAVHKALSRGG